MVRKKASCNTSCPAELQVIDSISGKWTVMIVYALIDGSKRNSQLMHHVQGISQKVLIQTLRRLERDGIVERKVYPVVPPQVEYSLTTLGQSLVDMLMQLRVWALEHYADVKVARASYDSV